MKFYQNIQELVDDIEKNPIEGGGELYHPIPFEEFSHLKTSSNADEVEKKFGLIRQAVKSYISKDFTSLKVLDVGANAGFYSFSFAKDGADVVSFEPHERYSSIGKFLAKEKKLPVDWHYSTFEPDSIKDKKFDMALMLSVFQWMAAGSDENLKVAKQNLHYISTVSDFLFFELGFNSGRSCLKTSKINHYAALIDFLQTNTNYKFFKLLGITELWAKNKRFLVLCSNSSQVEDGFWRKILRMIKI